MTKLDQTIKAAQRRLWLNRWLLAISWSAAIGGMLFAVVVLVQRLYDLPFDLMPIAGGGSVIALTVSFVWTYITRENEIRAATALDEAAGLHERLSSGQYCQGTDDPFAKAVLVDAENISRSITPRKHIRLTTPKPLSFTVGSFVLAALMFLVTPGLLNRTEANDGKSDPVEAEQTKLAVKKKMEQLQSLADDNPILQDLMDPDKDVDSQSGGMLRQPENIRHQAIKKIDRLEDALKQKRESSKYKAINELRRMMRGIKEPKSMSSPTQKLAKALKQGDFKAAKEELKSMREMLATLKQDKDEEMVKKLSKQLDDLAKQLEKASTNRQLLQKLEQAGIKKEDLKRMLENLKKEDIEQIKKQLADKGMSQKQISKMMQQLKKQQTAGNLAKQLAKAMRQSSSGADKGQMGKAMAGLSQAGDQLSELEMLEMEMSQMDSTMAGLNDMRNNLDKPCPTCKGTGRKNGKKCGTCQGSGNKPGSGMGKSAKQGRGGLASEQKTATGFKMQREKVHTGQGSIIGQMLIDGEQIKGDVSSGLAEVVTAAERDASDRISRDRIPRQYQKAVKSYFSQMQQSYGKKQQEKTTEKADN